MENKEPTHVLLEKELAKTLIIQLSNYPVKDVAHFINAINTSPMVTVNQKGQENAQPASETKSEETTPKLSAPKAAKSRRRRS